jgi:imidazolonepropionase-like amidohydrolase
MGRIVIKNASVFDGESAEVFPATVVVEGERIRAVAKGGEVVAADGAAVIDGTGMTLMPGLVEGHCHPSFTGIHAPPELGVIPPERHMLLTAKNCRLLLDHGFTSIFEAASAKPLLGVTARDAIAEGLIAGPRMRAGSPEITVTAGLGDERKRHIHQESFGLVADGPDEMRRVVRECVRDGVDTIKINISGDEFVSHARAEITPLTDAELAAVVETAHGMGKLVAAHARSSKSVKMAVRHGVDCIYHCDFADEEALDLLESVKDRSFVGPGLRPCPQLHQGGRHRRHHARGLRGATSLPQVRRHLCDLSRDQEARHRVVIGGDYGFSVTPMGQNARDIEHFVTYFGYSPAEALRCATVVGAELMGMGDELGRVKEGFIADLLLVKGNPLEDVSLVQRQENLAMIMQAGKLYKDPRGQVRVDRHLVAAE